MNTERLLYKLMSRVEMEVINHVDGEDPFVQSVQDNGGTWEGWNVRLKYMGRETTFTYMAKKGDYDEPELIWVLNSLMSSSFMYQQYKDDYFSFVNHVGGAYLGQHQKLKSLYDRIADGEKELRSFLKDDYQQFYTAFLPLKNLPSHVKASFTLDKIYEQFRNAKRARG